ncbi:unnamed protein product [Closterium sp. Naga37s-1]|nr:unnamed protein product [Closterium sp. Naga37s-1]
MSRSSTTVRAQEYIQVGRSIQRRTEWLGERVDEWVMIVEQQATGDKGAVEEQEGGAAAKEGGAGVQQQEGGVAVQEVVAGKKSGAPIESVASAGKGAVGNRGAPAPSGGAAGKGAGETWGNVRLSEPASPPPGPRDSPFASKKRQASGKSSKRAAGATESSDVVELVSLLGQAPVEAASTVVAG